MRFARVIFSQNYSFKGKKTGLLEFSPLGIGSKVLTKSAKQTQPSFSNLNFPSWQHIKYLQKRYCT